METKPLLYGLIGFFIGGLLVSLAATTFEKSSQQASKTAGQSMSEMTRSLRTKTGDEYDKAFVSNMIEHHQSAVDMARLSAKHAKHEEIKQLSREIIAAQQKEINQLKDWQKAWGYPVDSKDTPHPSHD